MMSVAVLYFMFDEFEGANINWQTKINKQHSDLVTVLVYGDYIEDR